MARQVMAALINTTEPFLKYVQAIQQCYMYSMVTRVTVQKEVLLKLLMAHYMEQQKTEEQIIVVLFLKLLNPAPTQFCAIYHLVPMAQNQMEVLSRQPTEIFTEQIIQAELMAAELFLKLLFQVLTLFY